MASWVGSTGSRRKQSVELQRRRVQQKIDSIHEQRDSILQAVDGIVENVNAITAKAEEAAHVLITEKDPAKMMHHVTPINTKLEEYLNQLIFIQYSLQGSDFDTETSDCESLMKESLLSQLPESAPALTSTPKHEESLNSSSSVGRGEKEQSVQEASRGSSPKVNRLACTNEGDGDQCGTEADNQCVVIGAAEKDTCSHVSITDNVHRDETRTSSDKPSPEEQNVTLKRDTEEKRIPSQPVACESVVEEKSLGVTVANENSEKEEKESLSPAKASKTGESPVHMTKNDVETNEQQCKEDHRSHSSVDSGSTLTVSTGGGKSRRKKKNQKKKNKVAELLQGVEKIVTETPLVEAELPYRVDYGKGPSISSQELIEGEILEVFVTEVFSPSFFWVQPFSPSLDDLSDRLNLHYKEQGRGWDQYLSSDPIPGMVVCAKFSLDKNWYRARVIAVHRGKKKDAASQRRNFYVDVLYVDYGNRDHKLAMDCVRPLHPEFANLPCQAFPCALSQAEACYGSGVWPEEVRMWFSRFLEETQRFSASLVQSRDDNMWPLYLVELFFDPNPKLLGQHLHGQFASLMHSVLDLMIKQGHAKKVDNAEVIRVYREFTLQQPVCRKETESHLKELDIHLVQAPKLIPKLTETPEGEKDGRSASMDSEDFKSQVMDESFDKHLDEELQKTLISSKHTQKHSSNEETFIEKLSSQHSSEDIKAYKAPDPQTFEPELHSSNTSGSKATERESLSEKHRNTGNSTEQKEAQNRTDKRTPKKNSQKAESQWLDDSKTQEGKKNHDLSEFLHQSSSQLKSDANIMNQSTAKSDKCDDVTPIKSTVNQEERNIVSEGEIEPTKSESSLSAQQRLLELGLPDKLPSACGFAAEYQSWMKGEASSLDAVGSVISKDQKSSETSLIPKSSTKQSDGEASSSVSSSGALSNHSKLSDSLEEQDNFEAKQFAPQEVVVPEDEFVRFLMAFIESPSKFWIHLVSNEAVESLNKLKQELNRFYSKDSVMMKKYFDSRELKLNTLCCAQYEDDRSLYRAKIIGLCHTVREVVDSKPTAKRSCKSFEPSKKISQVQVFYVDFGNTAWIPVTKVYPLPPKFTKLPPMAICCTLKGVEPLPEDAEIDKDEENKSQKPQWTTAACKAFEKLTGYKKELVGCIVDSTPGKVFCPDQEEPLPLLVVDTTGKDDIYIHEELVRKGLALGTQIHHIPLMYDVPDDHDDAQVVPSEEAGYVDYNPMADDYLSERNSYAINTDDPAVATMGYKPQDEKRVCRYFNTKYGCRRSHCPYDHVRTEGMITTDQKEVFSAYDTDHVAVPTVGSWVVLEVATVLSPGHFYAIFPFGTKPLLEVIKEENAADEGYDGSQTSNIMESVEALMESMSLHYEHKTHRDTDYTAYAEGEVVACLFTQDNRWYRARIIASEPEREQVRVFYVDFGNTEWVAENRIRQMEPTYMHLPFQALECFLPIEPVAKDGKWTKEARDFFHEFVDGKVLFAEVMESGLNAVLTLLLYDTTDGDVNVEKLLVERGFAKMQPGGKESHRSPRHNHRVGKSRHSSRSSSHSSGPVQLRMLPG